MGKTKLDVNISKFNLLLKHSCKFKMRLLVLLTLGLVMGLALTMPFEEEKVKKRELVEDLLQLLEAREAEEVKEEAYELNKRGDCTLKTYGQECVADADCCSKNCVKRTTNSGRKVFYTCSS